MAALGRREVLIQMTATITAAFVEYFSVEQRMDERLHASFAETIIEDYPHESPADVRLFIKYAARARYGERQKDGTVINRGKTYGHLTTTLAIEWFGQYLEEKVGDIEQHRSAELKSLNTGDLPKRVVGMMREELQKREEPPPDVIAGVRLLNRYVAHMTDDQLRLAWTKHRSNQERAVILQEANKRGLVQKYIEQHISGQDGKNECGGDQA